MQKYGGEAEAERAAEARKAARKKTIAKVKRGARYLCLAGLLAYGWMQRDLVKGKFDQAWNATFGFAESTVKAGKATENKAKQLQSAAEKRNGVIEDILK